MLGCLAVGKMKNGHLNGRTVRDIRARGIEGRAGDLGEQDRTSEHHLGEKTIQRIGDHLNPSEVDGSECQTGSGESEDYRKDVKHASNKSWTTNNSTGWKGNKTVKYWDPEWQRIVKKRVRAAIDAGYDGVYLDRIDAYEQVMISNTKQ